MARLIDADELIKTLESFMDIPNPGYAMGIGRAIWLVKDAPTLAPSNEPLAPEELREMVGQPVWTVGVSCTDDGNWAMWDIVESIDKDGITFGYSTESREWWNYNLRDAQDNLLGCAWTCYRRPQKEVRDDGAHIKPELW